MDRFFTKAFENMPEEAKESFLKTLFMQDDSDYATALRLEYYKSKLGFMGENVKIGKNVKLVNPQYIRLGDRVQIGDGATLIARGEGGITLGEGTRLQERVYLDTERTDTGYIHIGKRVYIGTGTTLFGHAGLEIGDYSLLAQNITLTPYSHKFDDPEKRIYLQGGHMEKVTIGTDVYIGMGVCILYSGSIGDGSVVGAGAVVAKPIPPYSVAVGNPAVVIRKRGG